MNRIRFRTHGGARGLEPKGSILLDGDRAESSEKKGTP